MARDIHIYSEFEYNDYIQMGYIFEFIPLTIYMHTNGWVVQNVQRYTWAAIFKFVLDKVYTYKGIYWPNICRDLLGIYIYSRVYIMCEIKKKTKWYFRVYK
jgi:hypothetical protein